MCIDAPLDPKNIFFTKNIFIINATSIHIDPIKSGSEQHNRREKELDYVRTDLSPLNESWSTESVSAKLADIKKRYTATSGQQLQYLGTPYLKVIKISSIYVTVFVGL